MASPGDQALTPRPPLPSVGEGEGLPPLSHGRDVGDTGRPRSGGAPSFVEADVRAAQRRGPWGLRGPMVGIPGGEGNPAGPWRLAWRELRRSRLALAGLTVLALLLLTAIFADLVALDERAREIDQTLSEMLVKL